MAKIGNKVGHELLTSSKFCHFGHWATSSTSTMINFCQFMKKMLPAFMLCVTTSNWLVHHKEVGHKVFHTILTFSMFGITAPAKACVVNPCSHHWVNRKMPKRNRLIC